KKGLAWRCAILALGNRMASKHYLPGNGRDPQMFRTRNIRARRKGTHHGRTQASDTHRPHGRWGARPTGAGRCRNMLAAGPGAMTISPKVTILLCTWNGARHLAEQLDSYLVQRCGDWALW